MSRLVLIILITATLLLWGCTTSTLTPPSTPSTPPTTEEPETQIIEMTAEQLYLAYKANQSNADSQFKGEILKVTGVVESMDKDATGTAYIILVNNGTDKIPGVKCLFSKGYSGEMIGITTGDTIVVQGMGFGYAKYPIITNCKLLERK